MENVLLISSIGGHLEQLLSLQGVIAEYDPYIVTEKNHTSEKLVSKYQKLFFLPYLSRRNKVDFLFKLTRAFFLSLKIYFKVRPKLIISTGSACAIPLFFIGKLFGCKLIFIETFSRTSSKTLTGKLCYYLADVFIIQWEELSQKYPKAVYLGPIY